MEGGEMQCDQLQSLPLFTRSSLRTKYNDIDTKEAEEGRADEAKRYMVKILPFNDKYTERLFTSSLLGDDCYLTIR